MADCPDTTNPLGSTSSGTRRGFLRQLTALPLIGGGLTLVGAPSAVAQPITDDLLHSYKCWLFMEHRMLSYELAGYDSEAARLMERSFPTGNAGDRWHFLHGMREGTPVADWQSQPQPSTRAALVLSAVGCNWREG